MPNLWNVQTQKPEWVNPGDVAAKLASGSYATYEGSGTAYEAGPGITAAVPAEESQTAIAAGRKVVAPGDLRAEQLAAEERASYDNLANEALALVEGGIGGLTAGLLDPADMSRPGQLRREVNPIAGGVGYVGGAVGGSLLGAGPAGWLTRGAGRAAEGVVAASGAGSAAGRLAVRELTQGAIESAGFAAGAQLGGSLWADRPFSGEAIVTDATVGALLGGALAGARGVAGRVSARGPAVTAADDLLNPGSGLSRGVHEDFRAVGSAWDGHVRSARERIDVLNAAAERGEIPGIVRGPLEVRSKALGEAERAQKELYRALRVSRGGDPWERLGEVLDSATPKRVAAVARQLDAYGAAVARLDEALQVQTAERALSPTPGRLGSPGPGAEAHLAAGYEVPGALAPRGAPTAVGRVPVRPPTALGVGEPPVNVPGQPTGFVTETFAGAPVDPRLMKYGNQPGVFDSSLGPPLGDPVTGATGPMAPQPARPFRRQPGVANVVPGQALRDFVGAAPLGTPPSPTQLGDLLSARLGKLDGVLGSRGASLDAAEAMGARVDGLGPLGERAVQLWALRRRARKMTGGRPERSAAGDALIEGAAMGAAALSPGGWLVKGAVRSVARAGLRHAVGLGQSIGTVKLAVARGVESILTDGVRSGARRGAAALMSDYGEGPTRDPVEKGRQLRALVGNDEALRARLLSSPAVKDVASLDPDLAAAMVDSAINRVKALAGTLPVDPAAESFPGVRPGSVPRNVQEVRAWESREAVDRDPSVAFRAARAGAVPPEVVEGLRDSHPRALDALTEQVLSAGPEVLAQANRNSLLGLSRLVGYPLIPEADAAYRFRQQERFRAAREANDEIQARQQGASAIRGGQMIAPTTGQVMASPPPPPNLR